MNHISSTIGPASRSLNPEALRSFVAICETGTFRRAAARVNRSPSAISLQIGKLEEQTGAKLMIRDARRVELTEQGEILLRYARQLLALSDEAMAQFHGSRLGGQLRLAAPHDLGVSLVPGLLHKFAATYPGVTVDVRLQDSVTVQHLFEAGEANIALFNEVRDPALKVRKLFSEPLVWLMHESGRAIDRNPIPLAIAETGCAWRDAALHALDKGGIPYRIAYASDTSMGQLAALRADLAIAALPRSLLTSELVEVPLGHTMPPLPNTHVWIADDGSDPAKALAAIAVSDGKR